MIRKHVYLDFMYQKQPNKSQLVNDNESFLSISKNSLSSRNLW